MAALRAKYGKNKHGQYIYANQFEWEKHPDHVYIGRANSVRVKINDKYIPFPAVASPFANPYGAKKYGREESIVLYEEYMRKKLDADPELVRELLALKGKTLGCWCAPLPCHGDVVLKLIEEYSAKPPVVAKLAARPIVKSSAKPAPVKISVKPKRIVECRPNPVARPIWKHTDTCYHLNLDLPRTGQPLAIFDFDNTLFTMDGQPMMDMIEAVRKHRLSHQVVVISNQYGITKGKTTHAVVQEKFGRCAELLGGDIIMLYATDKDKYRKPMTGMYDLLNKVHSLSFYCGDAAGRAGDFSVSDYYFAQNCGLDFKTPEMFLGKEATFVVAPKFRLYDTWSPDDTQHPVDIEMQAPFIAVMIGPQASGKSTLSKAISAAYDCKILNRDTIGSTAKLQTAFKKHVAVGHSIVVDNTNPTPADREKWCADGYSVYYYHFDIPKIQSMHMTHMRVQLGGPRIPPVAVHTYFKKLVEPTEDECDGVLVHQVKAPFEIPSARQDLPKEYKYRYNLKDR